MKFELDYGFILTTPVTDKVSDQLLNIVVELTLTNIEHVMSLTIHTRSTEMHCTGKRFDDVYFLSLKTVNNVCVRVSESVFAKQ